MAHYAASCVALWVRQSDDAGVRAAVSLVLAFFGCGLCFVMHLVLRRLKRLPFIQRAMIAFALTFVAAVINLAANQFALRAVGVEPGGGTGVDPPGEFIVYLGVWQWFFMSWAGLYLALTYSEEARRQAEVNTALAVAARDAELKALRYQINPHFLFNTLNSLSALVLDRRTREAEQMIGRLSTFLRTTLTAPVGAVVDLGDEIRQQRLYLEIEQVRHPELRVTFDLEEGLDQVQVPNFLLQPLIENAVRHVPRDAGVPANISVDVRSSGSEVVLTLINDLGVERGAGTGLGLENVRRRLELHYGDASNFTMTKSDNQFQVRIFLPRRRRP